MTKRNSSLLTTKEFAHLLNESRKEHGITDEMLGEWVTAFNRRIEAEGAAKKHTQGTNP